jgi:cell fate (sporulation/competence/biofilm development) regulator YmcA (YheA/YmcA/DUF963 family)
MKKDQSNHLSPSYLSPREVTWYKAAENSILSGLAITVMETRIKKMQKARPDPVSGVTPFLV